MLWIDSFEVETLNIYLLTFVFISGVYTWLLLSVDGDVI